MSRLVKLALWFSARRFHWKMAWPFTRTNLNFLYPNMLCAKFSLKLAQWFLNKRYLNFVGVFSFNSCELKIDLTSKNEFTALWINKHVKTIVFSICNINPIPLVSPTGFYLTPQYNVTDNLPKYGKLSSHFSGF